MYSSLVLVLTNNCCNPKVSKPIRELETILSYFGINTKDSRSYVENRVGNNSG
jgi:hypothetical protein